MTRSSYVLHRVLAGIVFVLLVFAVANYYLALGLIGDQQTAKTVMFALVVFVAVYGAYFAPSLTEVRKQRQARKVTKDG